MKRFIGFLLVCILFLVTAFAALFTELRTVNADIEQHAIYSYWFLLQRENNVEYLYRGVAGDIHNSVPVKMFMVKTGRPGERPTPLPRLTGRRYWLVTTKEATDNPETAPYFLTLNVPGIENPPYGPTPYLECNGQCNWSLPGAFGLHGVNGDESRLSAENPGSSGCIRHKDSDITYLYQFLDPQVQEIRYYIE